MLLRNRSAGTISISELAELSGISKQTLYDWRRKGLLQSIEVGREGGMARLDRKAAKEWIKVNTTKGKK